MYTFISASLLLLLGSTVITGWFIKSSMLVQVLPHFTPMQFNTALGFLLVSIALFTLEYFPRLSKVITAILAILATLTLIQYISGIDLAIDQIFVKAFTTVNTTYPGRMAPNTAVVFFITAIVLWFNGNKRPVALASQLFLSTLILLLAIASLIGYMYSIESTYSWGNITAMAVHTAVGFILIGLALTTIYYTTLSHKITRKAKYLIFTAILSTGSLFFILSWQFLVSTEHNRAIQYIESQSKIISEDIFLSLSKNINSIKRFMQRDKENLYKSESTLNLDAKNYLDDFPEITAFYLINKNGGIEHSIFRDNENKSKNASWNKFIEKCHKSLKSKKSKGLSIYIPKNKEHNKTICMHEKNQTLYVFFNMAVFMGNTLYPKINTIFHFNIYINDTLVFSSTSNSSNHLKTAVYFKESKTIGGNKFVINTYPTIEYIKNELPNFLIFFLIAGLSTTFCLGFSLFYAMNNREKNIMLESEILARKENETELRDFLYIAVHDLREPLRGIHNNASIFLAEHANNIDAGALKILERIKILPRHLEHLINALLRYSVLGRDKLNLKPVNTELLIHHAINEINSKNNQIEFDIPDEMPIIQCDPERLGDVFIELFENATHYNYKKQKRISVSFREKKDEFIFSVEDNGIGIEKRFHRDIFKIFNMLDKKIMGAKHVGAGLTIARKIVRAHGGKMWVESAKDKGSTFYFSIPK